MKKALLLLFIIAIVSGGLASAYDRGHVYITGVISDIGETEVMLSGVDEPRRTERLRTITLDGATYTVDPKCRIAIQYRENGAYHEKAGRFYDLRRGSSVYVKKIGSTISEILVEGWK